MKRKIFAIILLAVTIGFYSCQKEEENNPIDNNATKGAKKMTPENEAIYNSIVDFREKLLKKDYKAGESISTEDAILLMEASLNLTYRHTDKLDYKIENFENSINADRSFTNARVTYTTIYLTYQDILTNIRQTNANITEVNKKIRVIDLKLEGNNILINTAFEIKSDFPLGSFLTENLEIENAVNNRFAPNFASTIFNVETPEDIYTSELTEEEYWYLFDNQDQHFVKDKFVFVYTNKLNSIVKLYEYYAEEEGINNILSLVNILEQGTDKTILTINLNYYVHTHSYIPGIHWKYGLNNI
ncbi:MAG: hypothetical protein B6I24_06420 [Bacteroidetes bacterium 4572_128]|nr:MAG: hypothetical protein B6I24_06420 [Bacteroidetes bacterium 4572_128]